MKRMIIVVAICLFCFVGFVSADTFGTGAYEFTIDFVTISGDTNPTSGLGIVNDDYRMGKFEITNGQWSKFKGNYGAVLGNPGVGYNMNAYWGGINIPTNEVSWYEAAQFVNYLNTSKGHQAAYKFTGTQGTLDYTFSLWETDDVGYDSTNPLRNSNAHYFMPTRNEWVKAAYWNGTNIQTWATPDNLTPIAGVDSKYNSSAPWDVGSGSEELNGTFDMMGNLSEWLESPHGSSRIEIGGDYYWSASSLRFWANSFAFREPEGESRDLGFRVASVPEPATLLLLGLGGLVVRRRRV